MIVLIITLSDLPAVVILTTPCKVAVSGFDQGWGRGRTEVGKVPLVTGLSLQRGNQPQLFRPENSSTQTPASGLCLLLCLQGPVEP